MADHMQHGQVFNLDDNDETGYLYCFLCGSVIIVAEGDDINFFSNGQERYFGCYQCCKEATALNHLICDRGDLQDISIEGGLT